MGLDQYGMIVRPHPENTNFSYYEGEKGEDPSKYAITVCQWRKHPNLQGWMENLFNVKADAAAYDGTVYDTSYDDTPLITMTTPTSTEEVPAGRIVSGEEEMQRLIGAEVFSSRVASIGKSRVFNNQPIRLSASDIDELEMVIKNNELPSTTGFFFGDDADEEYKEKDLAFIEVARMAMNEGFEVYYDSWW